MIAGVIAPLAPIQPAVITKSAIATGWNTPRS
jgi:hypothetical protein